MPAKKLIIFPFNGNGIEALDCIDPGAFEFIGFIDDNYAGKQPSAGNWLVSGRDLLDKHPDAMVLAVPGGPSSYLKRKEYIQSLNIEDSRFATIIHPSVARGVNAGIGKNCLIMAGVVITSNARIGDHVCILPNSVIHHDSVVGDYSLIGSGVGIAGGTTVGKNCYIGSGSNLIHGISIGEYSLVGLGSNVIKNFPAHSRIAGNPAKDIPLKNFTTHG